MNQKLEMSIRQQETENRVTILLSRVINFVFQSVDFYSSMDLMD
ncbi:hypothetical protein CDIMF43_200228 [Carnobacterium divergens]|nr:hypothetical protein CDIMF43_200228 [Carnobacterium divergens]